MLRNRACAYVRENAVRDDAKNAARRFFAPHIYGKRPNASFFCLLLFKICCLEHATHSAKSKSLASVNSVSSCSKFPCLLLAGKIPSRMGTHHSALCLPPSLTLFAHVKNSLSSECNGSATALFCLNPCKHDAATAQRLIGGNL
jgi:hypothetical protein